ncbi:MAG TPA: malate dehydrogenase (quinone) [Solirubrobacteraceae bacterium]|nr:malate dehydrogenase (quinone) [Solirubrobacteraceae bacterium]
MSAPQAERETEVVLVGAGIMSTTLGLLLKELSPGLAIEMYEVLEREAQESSGAWNNAGTGHAALCELNYTPQRPDGSIDISKALEVNTEFDLSRQLWSYLIAQGAIDKPEAFIHAVPHMSFVQGAENVEFLKRRHAALTAHHCYRGMEYTEDRDQLADWVPLVMDGREPNEIVAATRMVTGADVDYGALTHALLSHLKGTGGFAVHFRHRVTGLEHLPDGRWRVQVKDLDSGQRQSVNTRFVFLGAGGGALPLLQKSEIPEGRGYAGFPVSGIWLRTDHAQVADRHKAKVYGKAASGSPPMSVPHLDARVIEGERHLLFGPYAGFSSKFLKHGHYTDMFRSIRPDNIGPMLAVGRHQLKLTEYLGGQVMESQSKRFDALRAFYPQLSESDWRLQVAGQRVQIIKRDPQQRGILEFGTEIVHAADGSLAALLGASPGASTAVAIMLGVLEQCFGQELKDAWSDRLKEMIPSYGKSLIEDAELCRRVRAQTAEVLHLQNV